MEHDLRSRTVALEQGSVNHENRLTALEEFRRQHDIAEATHSAEWKGMIERFNERFGNIETKISAIGDTLKYINRLIIAGFIAALLALVWKAGGAPLP